MDERLKKSPKILPRVPLLLLRWEVNLLQLSAKWLI